MLATAALETSYRIHPRILRNRFLYMSGALWFVPVLILILGEPFDPLFFAIFGVIWVFAIALFYWAGRGVSLSVSPEGVTYRAPGMNVVSTWDNVDHIGKRILRGEGEVEGLVLREPGMQLSNVVAAANAIGMIYWRYRLRMGRTMQTYRTFIPLSNLQTNEWRDAEIGADIRRYAPRLFVGQ
jgi:hypothetical protein